MLFGNKNLVGGKTHHPKSFYLEVALTGLAILSLLLLQPIFALACVLAVLFINHGLLEAMGRKHRRGFVLKSTGLIFARNATIILGALRGIVLVPLKKN